MKSFYSIKKIVSLLLIPILFIENSYGMFATFGESKEFDGKGKCVSDSCEALKDNRFLVLTSREHAYLIQAGTVQSGELLNEKVLKPAADLLCKVQGYDVSSFFEPQMSYETEAGQLYKPWKFTLKHSKERTLGQLRRPASSDLDDRDPLHPSDPTLEIGGLSKVSRSSAGTLVNTDLALLSLGLDLAHGASNDLFTGIVLSDLGARGVGSVFEGIGEIEAEGAVILIGLAILAVPVYYLAKGMYRGGKAIKYKVFTHQTIDNKRAYEMTKAPDARLPYETMSKKFRDSDVLPHIYLKRLVCSGILPFKNPALPENIKSAKLKALLQTLSQFNSIVPISEEGQLGSEALIRRNLVFIRPN